MFLPDTPEIGIQPYQDEYQDGNIDTETVSGN